MSDSPKRGPRADASADGAGVLSGLPRTRPQRASPRRDAARAARAPSKPTVDPVPKQGYESEGESLSGSVQPPGGTELIASAAELAGELAKVGVNASSRLLKDFLSRLPG